MPADKAISVVSYPKTGNKWLQFIIGRYVQNLTKRTEIVLPDGSENVNSILKAIGFAPIVNWTHAPLVWEAQTKADLSHRNVVAPYAPHKIALLVRYPLDTLLSAFFHNNYQKGNESRYRFPSFEAFIADPVYGLDKLIRFYQIWAEAMNALDIFVVRYENLHADGETTISNLFNFLGFAIDPVAMREAIAFSSFKNMQQIERRRPDLKYESSGLNVFGTGTGDDVKAMHVRFGVVGNYRSYLADETAVELERMISRTFPGLFGYHVPVAQVSLAEGP